MVSPILRNKTSDIKMKLETPSLSMRLSSRSSLANLWTYDDVNVVYDSLVYTYDGYTIINDEYRPILRTI